MDAPIVRKRASASECTSSANVVDSGSSRTVAASWKLTRCLLRFAAAFAGSHSNCTARVYGPVPGDHQTAERSELAASQGERSELWLVGCIQLLDGSANQLVRQPKCGSVAKAIAEPARPIDLLRPALVAGAVVSVREQ